MLSMATTQSNIFICLLDKAYETLLTNTKMEGQRWPEKSWGFWGGLEPSML